MYIFKIETGRTSVMVLKEDKSYFLMKDEHVVYQSGDYEIVRQKALEAAGFGDL